MEKKLRKTKNTNDYEGQKKTERKRRTSEQPVAGPLPTHRTTQTE
jgi:hypothetical protein